MIKINDTWVNPHYVTAIKQIPKTADSYRGGSEVWVVGNAGYGTFSVRTSSTPNEVAEMLNKEIKGSLGKPARKGDMFYTREEDIRRNY